MRLFRLNTNYQAYLDQHHASRAELAGQPYDIQHRALMEECFGWSDFWTHHLGKLGYAVWEPVSNAEVQQKQWAMENGVDYDDENWMLQISLAQVAHFKPDILLINDYHTFERSYVEHLREQCPSIKLVVGWCGAPYSSDDVFKAYDVTLSNVDSLLRGFLDKGFNAKPFQHGFSPLILQRLGDIGGTTYDFTFAGSVIPAKDFHTQRMELIEAVTRSTKLEIWSSGWTALRESLDHPKAASFVHPPVFGLEMYKVLTRSKVTLNSHINISLNHASNMRLFEATGVGACLLTDWTPNLGDLFEEDVEVLAYKSPEEAVEKARYLLDHPAERDAIAAAGQKRTLRDHSFDLKAQELDSLIQKELAAKTA